MVGDLSSFCLGESIIFNLHVRDIVFVCVKQADCERSTEQTRRHKYHLCCHPSVGTRSEADLKDTRRCSLMGFVNERNWSGDQLASRRHSVLS